MGHSLLLQRNARKSGDLFWNLFMLTMVPGPGKRTYIVGLQLDLGRHLPDQEIATNMESAWFKNHRDNLLKVQRSMFGNNPGKLPGPPNGEYDPCDKFLGLAEDIQNWLTHAEERCQMFQKWGTLPWVAWPTSRHYGLMNGGVSLLRLEADRIRKGAVAMSIFPVEKKPGTRHFKIKVDDVCPIWGCDVQRGSALPTMGFTLATPGEIDEAGGLPEDVEYIPQSVMITGNGRALCAVTDHEMGGKVVVHHADQQGQALFPYKVKPQDTIECFWGKGFLKIVVEGQTLFEVRDPVIFAPARDPAYAILDCCGAVSRTTLMT